MTTYTEVDIPPNKDRKDYTYTERRAELLQVVIGLGHPDLLSRTQMAQEYGVADSTISRDLDAISESLADELNDDAEEVTSVIYRKAIKQKVDDNDLMEAVELLESWNDWLFDTGRQEKAADKLEVDGDAGEAYMAALKDVAPDDEDSEGGG